MAANIGVVDYGMGNIHSILKALRLYSPQVSFSGDPDFLSRCDALVLPGDGAFGAARQGLRTNGLDQMLLSAQTTGKAVLGICIGFQVLFQDSNEDGLHQGLAYLEGSVRRFTFDDPAVRVPHMGWNQLSLGPAVDRNGLESRWRWLEPLLANQYMYFIHSFRVADGNPQQTLAVCNYAGDTFSAVAVRENTLALQFHPEKSARAGLAILERWAGQL
ncbi:MAG: imidazole glycerol phosphate synthase subunit HisH [Leptospiraceae bacterium]|nr:imidazole glycerol phosphate synthase subunit HisH [Leptospiraceae bacterium]